MNKDEERGFRFGVQWAVARIVEMYDEPSMAAEILRESGAGLAGADEADIKYLRIARRDPAYSKRTATDSEAGSGEGESRDAPKARIRE